MQDYEYAGLQRKLAWRAARRVIVPDAIPLDRLRAAGATADKLVRYPGLKEDYYLAGFEPDPAVLDELGLDRAGVSPTAAPTSGSSRSFARRRRPRPTTPTTRSTRECSTGSPPTSRVDHRAHPAHRRPGRGGPRARPRRRLIVPERAIDAQSLIAYADLVVSAGGTMNREAVALGVPVCTIFSGRMGAVDEQPDRRRPAARAGRPGGPRAAQARPRPRAGIAARSRDPRRRRSGASGSSPGRGDEHDRADTIDALFAFARGRRDRLAARPAGRGDRLADRRDRPAARAQPPHRRRPRSSRGSAILVGVCASARSSCPGTRRRARSSAGRP